MRTNIFESLQLLEKEIKEEIGERVILIKPNFVSINIQKAATEVNQVILHYALLFSSGLDSLCYYFDERKSSRNVFIALERI